MDYFAQDLPESFKGIRDVIRRQGKVLLGCEEGVFSSLDWDCVELLSGSA